MDRRDQTVTNLPCDFADADKNQWGVTDFENREEINICLVKQPDRFYIKYIKADASLAQLENVIHSDLSA